MQAQREGVALTDDRAMRRLAVRYNRQLAGEKGRQPSGEPALSSPPAPPGKAAKVGRNAPCPCGSGKKYKKCCGRPGAVGKPPGAPSS
jgi:preprotein translocase subunit SecA